MIGKGIEEGENGEVGIRERKKVKEYRCKYISKNIIKLQRLYHTFDNLQFVVEQKK